MNTKDIKKVNNQIGVPDEIFLSPKAFHLEMPLYRELSISDKVKEVLDFSDTVDAYCIYCKKESVFNFVRYRPGWGDIISDTTKIPGLEKYTSEGLVCTRNGDHKYTIYYRVQNSKIIKIGQYPSVADFQIPQIQKYRKLLGDTRHEEFVRAVGLAAHGVGIGSFAYLRRVFESLINDAYVLASKDPDFDKDEYERVRIEEKILLLKNFVPDFLVENRLIYAILSKGLHDLSEEECLKYFNPIKVGIELILDEKIEKQKRKVKIKKASAIIGKIGGGIK